MILALPFWKSKDGKTSLFKILSNIISSQVKLHAKYGGVYPFLAKREHQKNLPIVFQKALKKAKNPKINLIAVTVWSWTRALFVGRREFRQRTISIFKLAACSGKSY